MIFFSHLLWNGIFQKTPSEIKKELNKLIESKKKKSGKETVVKKVKA